MAGQDQTSAPPPAPSAPAETQPATPTPAPAAPATPEPAPVGQNVPDFGQQMMQGSNPTIPEFTMQEMVRSLDPGSLGRVLKGGPPPDEEA